MSEYQYYEFQTIDRPLTDEEESYISSLSSRVKLSPTRAVFTYSYGDLRANSKKLVAEYFDAHLYLANWGTKQLIFRFPKALVDVEEMQKYCLEDVVSLHLIDDVVVLDLIWNEEGGGFWIDDDDESLLSSMLRLREQILQQDYRLLYLAWLMGIPTGLAYDELSEESYEPPVPPGLGELSRALHEFAKLFHIDPALIQVAAQTSRILQTVSEEMLRQAISQLPREESDRFLLRLAADEAHLALQFNRRLEELRDLPQPKASEQRRTVAALLAAAEEERHRERKQQAQEADRQRIIKLEALAKRENQTWQEVERLIQKSQAKPYDQAVALLVDLKALAEYQGKKDMFRLSINQLITKYRRRSGLMRRFERVGLR